MARTRIPESTITKVLVQSRRRCCVCYGLNRDLSLKSGQVAHLDQNNSNSRIDNLSFLCLLHHDEYDSKTSQRKGFTESELKTFRSELYSAVGKALEMEVHFGEVTLPPSDPYAGHYIRIGGTFASAEITLTPLGDGLDGALRYAVVGEALWGRGREFGPNMGSLEFIGRMINDVIEEYIAYTWTEVSHHITLHFNNGKLTVMEEGYLGAYGMNVDFIGEYERTQ